MELPAVQQRDLYLIGDIEQINIGEITKRIHSINAADNQLMQLCKTQGMTYDPLPINLYIDSYGGDLVSSMGLVGVIEQSETPVHTIGVGAAMSGGFVILIAGHKRFCYEHATPLYHQLSGGNWGELETQKEGVKQSKKFQKWMEGHVLRRTEMTKKQLKKILKRKKDFYMDSEAALKLGVVDEVLKSA